MLDITSATHHGKKAGSRNLYHNLGSWLCKMVVLSLEEFFRNVLGGRVWEGAWVYKNKPHNSRGSLSLGYLFCIPGLYGNP